MAGGFRSDLWFCTNSVRFYRANEAEARWCLLVYVAPLGAFVFLYFFLKGGGGVRFGIRFCTQRKLDPKTYQLRRSRLAENALLGMRGLRQL